MQNQVSKYKISTITATGSVNTDVNLDILFGSIEISSGSEGVMFAEYGVHHKGVPKKASVTKRRSTGEASKRFDNQLTLEYRFKMGTDAFTVLNCKIFRNGNVQMTGIKFIEQGSVFVDRIVDIVMSAPDTVANKTALKNTNYMVRMINCDYRVGFSVKRDALFRLMINEYENMSSFEPCIYPGVKIQYMWNIHNASKMGICRCEEACIHGKGDGVALGKCKKITVAVFQSGCVIITGAQNKAQIDETYEWINNIIVSNRDLVEKKSIVAPTMMNGVLGEKKKVMLPRSKIVSLRPACS